MAGNSEKTAKRPRGKGKPFAKGQSGNPRGRPKVPADVKEAYRAMHPRALERLEELLESEDEKTALKAAEVVIERVEGKVAQPLEHSGTIGWAQLVEQARALRKPR